MNDETRVEWREWGREPFSVADRAGKPVLLSLTATWCTQCAEMDAETYADPRIAANVNDGFVPVRVDVDRHPRVRDRYNAGGFPSTVFLTPAGTVVTAAGYLGPDAMRGVIDGVRRRWDAGGESAGDVPRSLQDNPTPAGELTEEIETRLVGQLRASYDEEAGGWGDGAKFPMPRTVEFALKREREMALRTLNAISANLLDDYEGGFFRHATERDWSDPQYEKVLDTNAGLVRTFANAYLLTGREEYRTPAARAIEYLTTTLWVDEPPGFEGVPGAFAASQAPGPGATYYTQDPSDRDDDPEPPVDRTVVADWNALAVDGLLAYHACTDDDRARRYAIHALETLRTGLIEGNRVVHYRGLAGPDGKTKTARAGETATADGTAEATPSDSVVESGERGLLVDHARVIQACCTARQVLGPDTSDDRGAADRGLVATAEALAEYALEQLRPDGDSFVDGPATGPGLLDRPFRPLDGNVELAEALLELAALTGTDRYRGAARAALEAFAGAADRFGPQAAAYGTAVGRVLDPGLRIELTAPAGSDLHRAALRIADHEAVVVPAVDAGDVRETEIADPDAAVVVVGEDRSSPVTDPAALGEAVQRRFESI